MRPEEASGRLEKILLMLRELIGDLIKENEGTEQLKIQVLSLDAKTKELKDKATKYDTLLPKLKDFVKE